MKENTFLNKPVFQPLDEQDRCNIVTEVLVEGQDILDRKDLSDPEMRLVLATARDTIVDLYGATPVSDFNIFRKLKFETDNLRVSMRNIFNFGYGNIDRKLTDEPAFIFALVREVIEDALSWMGSEEVFDNKDKVMFAINPEATGWAAAGFDPESWGQWSVFGFKPAEAAGWRNIPVPIGEAIRWKKIGSQDYRDWKPVIHKAKVQIFDVVEWREHGVTLKEFTERLESSPNGSMKPFMIFPGRKVRMENFRSFRQN